MKEQIARILPLVVIITSISCTSKSTPPEQPPKPAPIRAMGDDVSHLRVDTFEITVRDFRLFVEETAYVTTADSFGWSGIWDTINGEWSIGDKANWQMHDGLQAASDDFPVVHVSYRDACQYCAWRGGRLPTATEWDAIAGDTVIVGNVWQGLFPRLDEGLDGYKSVVAPVGQFRPNVYGYYDLFGNVWEWTSTLDPRKGERIIKGGSFLCDYNVCQGYIPSRYQTTPDDSGLNHLGFRCVYEH